MAKTAKGKSQPETTTTETIETGAAPSTPTEEEIAVRAYHIYLERGGGEADPMDDWLQAERELTEGKS